MTTTSPLKALSFLMVAGLLTSTAAFSSSAHDSDDERPPSSSSSTSPSSPISDEYIRGLFDQGEELKNADQFQEALPFYNRLIELGTSKKTSFAKGDRQIFFSQKGICLHKLERTEEAVTSYKRALKKDRSGAYKLQNNLLALTLHNLGEILLHNGENLKALGYLKSSIKARANELSPRIHLVICLFDLKRYGEVITDATETLSLMETYEGENKGQLRKNMLSYRAQSNMHLESYQEAYNDYTALLALAERADVMCLKEKATCLHNRGTSSLNMQDYKLAIEDYQKSLDMKDEYGRRVSNQHSREGTIRFLLIATGKHYE